jgi:hypothetical protein
MSIPEAILGAMPGSMAEVAVRTGITGPLLWNTAAAMRVAGILHRGGKSDDGKLLYRVGNKPLPPNWEPHLPPELVQKRAQAEIDRGIAFGQRAVDAVEAADGEVRPAVKPRKRHVITFHIPGWPSQDPNRPMVWRVCYEGSARANSDIKRLNKNLKKEAVFEVQMLTPL